MRRRVVRYSNGREGAGGYREWRRAFDVGKAGVFSITVAEALEFMESAINR